MYDRDIFGFERIDRRPWYRGEHYFSLAVGDVEGDGDVDIFTIDNNLFESMPFLNQITPIISGPLSWPMERHDAGRTGGWTAP